MKTIIVELAASESAEYRHNSQTGVNARFALSSPGGAITLSYYMRYIAVDERPITLDDVRRAFAMEEEDYAIDGKGIEANVTLDGRMIAQVTINIPGDGLFDHERAELLGSADDGEGAGKASVLETLGIARTILAVQVLFGDADPEETLDALDPLWGWLQDNRRGLLQADGEGYYDTNGLILELD